MKSLSRITLSLLFLLPLVQGWSQSIQLENFSSLEVGHSQVNALLEDHQGYLWIGTWGGGLSRYDGYRFEHFNRQKGPKSIYVNALYQDKKNKIWIGTDEGLSNFDGKKFNHFYFNNKKNRLITTIIEDHTGQLIVGTVEGVFSFQEKKGFTPFSDVPSSIVVNDLFIDRDQRLWIASDQGVFNFKNDQINHLTTEDGLNRNKVEAITQRTNGDIWMATATGGINIFDGKEISRFVYSDQLEEGLGINTIYTTTDDQIWIGLANQGVAIYQPRDSSLQILRERTTQGLESDNVRVMLEDRWGNHWLGTSGGGLSRYFTNQQPFKAFTERDGLADKEIYAISEDQQGKLWLATSRGIVIFNEDKFINYSRDQNFADVKCRAVHVDQQNQIWVGTEGAGLKMFDGKSYRQFQPWDGIEGNLIQDITEDSLGNIWIGMMDSGITRLSVDPRDSLRETYRFKNFSTKNGLPSNAIYDLHIDQLQRVWFATRGGGIGYIENDSTILNFSRKEGLPAMEVRTLTEDSLGFLWGGTSSGGVFNIHIYGNNPIFRSFDESDGLSSDNIYLLGFQNRDEIWIGNQRGVDRITVSSGRDALGAVLTYGALDGFTGGETCESAILTNESQTTWFGTIGGLMRYTPQNTEQNTDPPLLHFTNIRVAFDSLSNTVYSNTLNALGQVDSALVFAYNDNNISFEYLGIHLGTPKKVRYQWRLNGLKDAEWSAPQISNRSDFPYLPPGDYQFQVIAINGAGVASSPEAIHFMVQSPFWETWWFRLSVIGLAILLITGFFISRIRAVRREAKINTTRIEMEKHVLELEQKALQLQMNPHFIFNVLNTIQSKINANDHREARYQLAKFSKLMRATLENSRTDKITLEEEMQSLENYLAMEKMSRNDSFDYKIETVGSTNIEQTLLPPMLIQPFVENAIIHGISHITRRGKITVIFTQRNGFLECVIADNGIGRVAAKAIKSQVEAQHKSVALEVTRERLNLLSNEKLPFKKLEMQDILEDGEVVGTKVWIRIF